MASEPKRIDLLMLWEGEIRKAAELIKYAEDLPEGTSEKIFKDAWVNALRACRIAIKGAERKDVILMLANESMLISKAKKG